ncbi:hypothetical protein E4634_01715 [Mangrovimicrobium sediminis]|uniref:Uncharacterized protein n=1 Tax=Mangrovimicrobium sediminis TaxID=2562682 RepID=A0A4Z0M7I6_9GAMM|nr:hypothetical protein [Haliea sp. SAOS-164]TGD75632.1 hypothetical protein E4634_01715 [Haliea sp. SAOS-164]
MKKLVYIVVLALAPLAAAQEPTVELESRVIGNRELPRVMYIVPWRQAPDVDLGWEPEQVIAGELFQPLRRDEYRRQLHYREKLAEPGDDGSGASSTSTDSQRN